MLPNLLSNAIKYSPNGGQIEVSVEERGPDVLLAVRDDGAGIAPDLLPRLFDPFYRVERTARAARGLGLGLHITRSLVEAHGGRIHPERQGEGRGSTFPVFVPRQLGESVQ